MKFLKTPRFLVMSMALMLMGSDSMAQNTGLSLDQAIEHAKANNTEILNAKLEVQIAESEVKSIIATGLPQLNANGIFTHNLQIAAMQLPDFISPAVYGVLISEDLLSEDKFKMGEPQAVKFGAPSMLTGQVTLSQLLFDGTYLLGLKAAKEFVNLSRLIYEMKEVNIVESVTKAYYMAVLSDQVYIMLSDNQKTTKEVRDQTEALVNAGLAEQLDLDRIDFALSSIDNRLKTADMQRTMSLQMLKLLAGMDVSANISLSTSFDDLETEIMKEIDTELTLNDRIEYQILEEQLVLDSMNVKRFKVGYYPSLTLNANHQQNSFASSEAFVDLGKDWFPGTSYSLNLSIPIFDGFYKRSKIEQTKLKQIQDRNSLNNLANSVQFEVNQTALNFSIQKNNLETQDKNRKLARSIFDKTRIKFNEGMGSSFEMIQAENDLYRAEIEYTNTIYNLLVAQIELQKALGKL